MDNVFPSRKEIIENQKRKDSDYQERLLNDIKSVNVEKVDFSNGNFKPRSEIVEKQKVFSWIRVFLREETKIDADDTIRMQYLTSGEFIDMQFACFAKKGLQKDTDGEIVNYNNEDDTKTLCIMVDLDRVNNNNSDIPFIKTLFRMSAHFEFQLLKTDELKFTNITKNIDLDFYDTEF
jgi:hypothetical protein